MAQRLQGHVLKVRGQAEPLEPVDQVVGQKEQMEVGLVGEKVPSGDAAQRIVSRELVDQQFDGRAVVVKAPEIERLQWQVGAQHVVVILVELEERQLGGGLLGLRASHHDEPVGMRPASRLVAELGDLDPTTWAGIPQVRQLAFDGGRPARDDHEAGSLPFEPLDQRVVVKPFVRADNHQPDPGRNLRETRREQVEGPAGGMGIARPQFAMPEVLGPSLEAEQRVVRRSAALDRVVADPCPVLVAIDHQDSGVDIEDQPRRPVWAGRHPRKKAVVQGAQLGQRRRRHPQQEAPQGRRIRIGVEPREVLEHAVLSQQLRCLDPFQSQDHRIEQREQHFADAVVGVSLHHAYIHGHRILEPDPRKEPMEQIDTTVMGQCLGPKRDRKIPRSLRHRSEPYPRGSPHCKRPQQVLIG